MLLIYQRPDLTRDLALSYGLVCDVSQFLTHMHARIATAILLTMYFRRALSKKQTHIYPLNEMNNNVIYIYNVRAGNNIKG